MDRLPPIFDAQIHAENLGDRDLEDLAYFGVEAAIAIAGDDAPADSVRDLLRYLEVQIDTQTERLRKAGIAPFVAVGIHPQRLPIRGLGQALAELPALLDRGRVAALGAIGLAEGGEREEEAFVAQLELAASLRVPVIVNTPDRSNPPIARRVLSLLKASELPPSKVLVGAGDPGTVRVVREFGFHACLTVHPARLPAEAAVRIIRQYGGTGILLASEAGAGASDLLAVPRTLHLLERAGISPEITRRVGYENAIDFFGVDRRVL
ncbi:TatD family hydrolase [Vulgatibacter incomptus]|uniref:Hydrolase TatD n=1 Tax=Vulgatibacter incomptus TaxID=1391653 RepID=A0A0K1PF48_9BACT|nr:TatD family hydrolase [Vulgatibacter incomptus]AKU92145.1 hypothetical protein AKJ08_2532 [Vulgatibacter incomptus]